MTVALTPIPVFRAFDANGAPLAGGKLYSYEAGTSTPKSTYTDFAKSGTNTNPTILDSEGYADVWLDGDYKLVLKTSADVTIWTVDNVTSTPSVTGLSTESGVANGSFETDSDVDGDPDNWTLTLYTGGSRLLDNTTSMSGAQSLKFTSAGTGGGYATSDFYEAVAGEYYTIYFAMKSSDAGVRNVVQIDWYNAAQTLLSSSTLYDNSTTNPTSWTAYAEAAVAPANAAYMKIKLTGCHESDATVGSTWFDAVERKTNRAFYEDSSAIIFADPIGLDIAPVSGYQLHSTTSAFTDNLFKFTNGGIGESASDGFDIGLSGAQAVLWNNDSSGILIGTGNTDKVYISATKIHNMNEVQVKGSSGSITNNEGIFLNYNSSTHEGTITSYDGDLVAYGDLDITGDPITLNGTSATENYPVAVGIGAPKAVDSTLSALQIGSGVIHYSKEGSDTSSTEAYITNNVWLSSGVWKYILNGYASYISNYNGSWVFYNAPTGTAGNSATLTAQFGVVGAGYGGVYVGNPSAPAGGYSTGVLNVANGYYSNGSRLTKTVILDTPELITSSPTTGAWTTVNNATLGSAGAIAALIRIYLVSTTSTAVNDYTQQLAYLRETGSGAGIASAQNRVSYTLARCIVTAQAAQDQDLAQHWVTLDSSADFDYYIDRASVGTPTYTTSIYLDGYIVEV